MPISLNARLVAFSPLFLLVSLGACGDSSTPAWTAPPAGYYQTLDSTAAQSNDLGGVGIRSNDANGNLEVVEASGSLRHDTGALNYNDGTYNLIDPDGIGGGIASDGAGGTLSEATGLYAGTYEYVMPVTFSYFASGVAYTTQGFAGLTTEAAHIPISGSATYNGEATGNVITTSGFYDLASGVSAISVDFGAGTADVTLNGFTATDALGAATTAPLDTVLITGMSINGSTFTDGALVTLLSSATVNLTGANTTISSEGMFFGWDSIANIPAELAGVSVAVGDDGIMLFSFIAN